MNLSTLRELNGLTVLGSVFIGAILGAYIESKQPHLGAAESANQMEGYYDPVNKVMCYWIKDSKATPACLIVEWPFDDILPPAEAEGTGDETYYQNKERAKNATFRY